VKLLSLVDVLEPLAEEDLRELARRCDIISLREEKDFYRPEEHDGGLFLILEGHVRVYLTDPAAKETTLELLSGGTVLWAHRLELVDDRGAHAQAFEPTTLAFMARRDFNRLIPKKPEVASRMIDLLNERLASINERLAEIARKDVLSRLAHQILRLLENEGVVDRLGGYKLLTAYTHEELGTMIGAERVAVNRALGQLRDEGAVELRQRRIHVRDLEALRRIGEQER
jgi:CRP/FNR family transcriptional regulator